MCPGCNAAGALPALGAHPIRTLIDALASVLPMPSRTEPSTAADEAEASETQERADVD